MACVLLKFDSVLAIGQLELAFVAKSNAARQLVACALFAAAPACAAGSMSDADGAPQPSIDAYVTPSYDAAPPAPDAAATDAAPSTDGAPKVDGAPTPYRNTITIDGVNDFVSLDETFTTTSAGYGAYVAWDDTNLYLGYDGVDIASTDANRWVQFFFDVDPGDATGATVGEQYNTQQPGMPAGFGAEYYFRWRASNDFQDLQSFASDVWSDTGITPTTFQSGTFVETAIPLTAFGTPATLGVTSLMINETPGSEGAYAGLYAGSFTDGYYDATKAPIPLGAYLEIDFTSPDAPNDPANKKP